MDQKKIAVLQESMGETSSQSVVVAVDRSYNLLNQLYKYFSVKSISHLPIIGICK